MRSAWCAPKGDRQPANQRAGCRCACRHGDAIGGSSMGLGWGSGSEKLCEARAIATCAGSNGMLPGVSGRRVARQATGAISLTQAKCANNGRDARAVQSFYRDAWGVGFADGHAGSHWLARASAQGALDRGRRRHQRSPRDGLDDDESRAGRSGRPPRQGGARRAEGWVWVGARRLDMGRQAGRRLICSPSI